MLISQEMKPCIACGFLLDGRLAEAIADPTQPEECWKPEWVLKNFQIKKISAKLTDIGDSLSVAGKAMEDMVSSLQRENN